MTLANAYKHTISKLTPEYLSSVETDEGTGVKGEDLVKMVNFINNHLLKIRSAIKKYGKDFQVPLSDDEIPEGDKDMFFGCGNWVPR